MSVNVKKSTWPRQAAIVVSDSPNVHMLLRELLRSYNWTVTESTPSVEHAVSMVRLGQAYLVILDDTVQVPSSRHLRFLLSDPLATCTPVLSFLLDVHKSEIEALSKMGRPELVEKPLTPSKFVPGFINLVRTWEKEPFVSLRRANYHFVVGNEAQGLRGLARVAEAAATQPFAAQALALHLRRLGRIKQAETVLLAALKRSPRELGTIMALAHLYMHAAMPKMAHRLLLSARSSFGQSHAVIPDLVQAAIMLGAIDDAIQSMNLLIKSGQADDETLLHLTRLLLAEGRDLEAERLLVNHRAIFKKIQAAWIQAEQQPLNAAG